MSMRTPSTAALIVVAFVGLVWFLQAAEAAVAPMLLGLVLGVVAAPFSDRADRAGLHPAISAFVVLLATIAFGLAVFAVLWPVVADAVSLAPRIEYELRKLLATVQPALEDVAEFQKRLEDTLNEGTEPAQGAGDEADEEQGVAVPSPLEALWYAPGLLGRTLIFTGTLYFFLLARKDLYRALELDGREDDSLGLSQAEADVSRYFLTITAINATLGGLVAAAMMVIGMPNPLVWGLAAFLVNFILYLGPIVFFCVLLVAGILVFDGPVSFLPALVYGAMDAIEGQFVTPALVGRQMAINPLLVFVSLVFWLWLWGPLGGIIAIPLLVWGLRIREVLTRAPADPTAAPGTTEIQELSGESG